MSGISWKTGHTSLTAMRQAPSVGFLFNVVLDGAHLFVEHGKSTLTI